MQCINKNMIIHHSFPSFLNRYRREYKEERQGNHTDRGAEKKGVIRYRGSDRGIWQIFSVSVQYPLIHAASICLGPVASVTTNPPHPPVCCLNHTENLFICFLLPLNFFSSFRCIVHVNFIHTNMKFKSIGALCSYICIRMNRRWLLGKIAVPEADITPYHCISFISA